MNRICACLFAAGAAALLSACPRSQPPAAAPAPAATNAAAVPARPPASPRPAPTAEVPAPAAATPAAPADIPLRVSALMEIGGESRAGVIDPASGRGVTLRVGEAFLGYTLKAIDLDAQETLFERDGREYRLRTVGDPTPLLQPPPAAAAAAVPAPGPDFSNLPPPPRFDPTEDEVKRGIDPNNPSTWPPDYRGPGIERAIQEMEKKKAEAFQSPGGTN